MIIIMIIINNDNNNNNANNNNNNDGDFGKAKTKTPDIDRLVCCIKLCVSAQSLHLTRSRVRRFRDFGGGLDDYNYHYQ